MSKSYLELAHRFFPLLTLTINSKFYIFTCRKFQQLYTRCSIKFDVVNNQVGLITYNRHISYLVVLCCHFLRVSLIALLDLVFFFSLNAIILRHDCKISIVANGLKGRRINYTFTVYDIRQVRFRCSFLRIVSMKSFVNSLY